MQDFFFLTEYRGYDSDVGFDQTSCIIPSQYYTCTAEISTNESTSTLQTATNAYSPQTTGTATPFPRHSDGDTERDAGFPVCQYWVQKPACDDKGRGYGWEKERSCIIKEQVRECQKGYYEEDGYADPPSEDND